MYQVFPQPSAQKQRRVSEANADGSQSPPGAFLLSGSSLQQSSPLQSDSIRELYRESGSCTGHLGAIQGAFSWASRGGCCGDSCAPPPCSQGPTAAGAPLFCAYLRSVRRSILSSVAWWPLICSLPAYSGPSFLFV